MNRWYLQLSLRFSFLLLTCVCLWAGWWSSAGQRQARAVATIRKLGGDVYYEFDVTGPPELTKPKAWQRWIGIDYFAKVTIASLEGNEFDDDTLSVLRDLPDLNSLRIKSSRPTDKTIDVILGLKQLHGLTIHNAEVTPSGLRRLRSLSTLGVFEGPFRADCLAEVASWPQGDIERPTEKPRVDARDSELDDAALRVLAQIPNIRTIYTEGSKVTPQGALDASLLRPPVAINVGRRCYAQHGQFVHESEVD